MPMFIIVGVVLLSLWLILCIIAVRLDLGDSALWRIIALLGNFFWLTLALPSFVENAACIACWSDRTSARLNMLVVGALVISVIFLVDIARMARAAQERRTK